MLRKIVEARVELYAFEYCYDGEWFEAAIAVEKDQRLIDGTKR